MRTITALAILLALASCEKDGSRCVECETMRQVYVNPDPNGPYLWVDTFVVDDSCYCGEDYQEYINQNEATEGNSLERFVTNCRTR